jgi:hypothetical protein
MFDFFVFLKRVYTLIFGSWIFDFWYCTFFNSNLLTLTFARKNTSLIESFNKLQLEKIDSRTTDLKLKKMADLITITRKMKTSNKKNTE